MHENAKPILFSTDMVRAILADRKTQTRRLIKPQYAEMNGGERIPLDVFSEECDLAVFAPYQPGDILYVREAWNGNDGAYWYKADYIRGTSNPKWRPSIHMPREAARIFLRVKRVWAERVQDISAEDCIAEGIDLEWSVDLPQPSYMSLAYSEARVKPAFIKAYAELWDRLSAKRDGGQYAWDKNPWVFAYEFERMEG